MIYWMNPHKFVYERSFENHTTDDAVDYYENMKKIIIDDYVIEDFHVNKKHGLGKFATDGAFVKDEDLSLFENGENTKNTILKTNLKMIVVLKRRKKRKKKEKKKQKKRFIYKGEIYCE